MLDGAALPRATGTATDTIADTAFLDEAALLLECGEIQAGFAHVVARLRELRCALAPEDWKAFATGVCRQHPILAMLHQEPVTSRAYAKPRGYAGDAELLDIIYAADDPLLTPPELAQATLLGRQLWETSMPSDACWAVRRRRQVVAERLDRLAECRSRPHVLSIACGHLREARISSAVQNLQMGRFMAVDQDGESMEVVERELRPLGVEPVLGSVRDIVRRRLNPGQFDFIYSAGLYDYLTMPMAQTLTVRLFDMLNPGGQLIVANFLPNIHDAGYMEAIMDWWLLYRDKAAILEFAQQVPESETERITLFAEERCNIGFMEITRKG